MMANRDIGTARRFSRRQFLGMGAAGGVGLLLTGCGGGGEQGSSGGGGGTINALFMKQAAYSEDDVRSMTKEFQRQNPDIKVKLTFVAYEALHDKIVASAPAGTYDTVLVDVVWPAEFASKNMIVDVTDRFPKSERNKILQGALETTQYQNKYYGVPWIVDTKYFYYNRDMLSKANVNAPPDTWQGVVDAARAIKSAGIVEHPLVWSWSQAEALMCDYATLLGAFGGKFFDGDKPAFNTGGGLQALEFMRMTLDEGLSNPASTESLEEDVRRIFSQGQAAMALNWTYMFSLANDPKESQVDGKVDIAHVPKGPSGAAPGVNGSMGMAISNGSQNQDAAWKYIQFMTSQKVQNNYAELSLPIWESSYEDKKVVQALPEVVPVAEDQLNDMILRPVVPQYNDVSHTMQVEIQRALNGSKTPKQALDDAANAVSSAIQSS